jgi:hypothetical protein
LVLGPKGVPCAMSADDLRRQRQPSVVVAQFLGSDVTPNSIELEDPTPHCRWPSPTCK